MNKNSEVKPRIKYVEWIFVSLVALMFALNSCKKEDAPLNPYADVNYNPDSTAPSNPDLNSIIGLHKNIFSPRCAMPGCHDGTFEPDYRTVRSTYSTLVYQHVTKTTVDSINFFQLRVIPYDVAHSFLHERLTTSTSDYMPSNGSRLSQAEIQHIDNWIANGAKDENGNVPVAPDLPPVIEYPYFYAVDSGIHRLDSIRLDGISYNPFLVQSNQTIIMVFFVTDDSTAVQDFLVNRLKLSLDMDDFSAAVSLNAVYYVTGNFWLVTFQAAYPSGTTVYFRYYVNDGNHINDTEFPRGDFPFYYKMFASFYVQ
jgi:hypothetical protein